MLRGFVLAIETSNPASRADGSAAEVAIAERSALRSAEPLIEPVRGGQGSSDDLAQAIERLFRRARASPRELSSVVVSVGPGGLTALRVACATSRMLAEALGAEIVAVPSADVAARAAPANLASFAVVLASKRRSAWVACYARARAGQHAEPDPAEPPRVMTPAELAEAHDRRGWQALLADAHLDESMRAWADARGVPVAPPDFNAAALLDVGAHRPPTPPDSLVPLYAREPEAVTKWRELGRPL